jgi:bifunctional enzyme CysN/CysC
MHSPLDTAARAAVAARRAGQGLLRVLICGSVDDGKSTLIGRLLYDSKSIFDDQLSAVQRDSRRYGTVGEETNLALFVDGLEAERQQGITIDVAYRYFTTGRRAFIIADAPGHEQYTRNMATGASTADLALVLVDARQGLLTQTRRHTYICSMLGIHSVVLVVNKIDLVGFSCEVFRRIVADYLGFTGALNFGQVTSIPLSARYGDNVAARSARTPWYDGPTLLDHLQTVDIAHTAGTLPLRFPVQWVNRRNLDFRGFAGTVASGRLAVGDNVVIAASGKESRIARIVTFDSDRDRADAGDAVTLTLAEDLDIARGDVLASPENRPQVADQFAAHVLWMSEEPLLPGRSYLLRIGTRTLPARVTTLKYKVDVNMLAQRPARTLALNEIAFCNLWTASPVAFDAYADNRRTGAFILIDRFTNATAGAGMIAFALRRAANIHRQSHLVGKAARATLNQQTPCVLWFTGLSGSGKSTIANLVEKALNERHIHTMMLDGDNIRHGLNRDLGFTEADRVENIRRVGEVARLFVEAGLVVLCCLISPFRAEREMIRELLAPGEFVEIFVDAPLAECIRRDPKGLYAKALAGNIKNFTGIDSPYEAPEAPDIRVDGTQETPETAAVRIVDWFLASQARQLPSNVALPREREAGDGPAERRSEDEKSAATRP